MLGLRFLKSPWKNIQIHGVKSKCRDFCVILRHLMYFSIVLLSESTPASNSVYIDVSNHIFTYFRSVSAFSIIIDHYGSLVTIMDHDWSWSIMTDHHRPWSIMIHQEFSWLIMMDHDWSWPIMIHHDWSWSIMIDHAMSSFFRGWCNHHLQLITPQLMKYSPATINNWAKQ